MNPISTVSSMTNLGVTQTNGVGAPGSAQPGIPTGSGSSVSAADGFTQNLTNAIGNLAGLQVNADQAAAGLAQNQGVDIHQAMIAMEQASLGMNLAVQVRDKAVEAYQTLMNMQM